MYVYVHIYHVAPVNLKRAPVTNFTGALFLYEPAKRAPVIEKLF